MRNSSLTKSFKSVHVDQVVRERPLSYGSQTMASQQQYMVGMESPEMHKKVMTTIPERIVVRNVIKKLPTESETVMNSRWANIFAGSGPNKRPLLFDSSKKKLVIPRPQPD